MNRGTARPTLEFAAIFENRDGAHLTTDDTTQMWKEIKAIANRHHFKMRMWGPADNVCAEAANLYRRIACVPFAGPLELGAGYEQGNPGWYLANKSGLVVLVIDDEIELSTPEAVALTDAINSAGWKGEGT